MLGNEPQHELIQIRISKEEKIEIKETAKQAGFSGISEFFRWLYRNFRKK